MTFNLLSSQAGTATCKTYTVDHGFDSLPCGVNGIAMASHMVVMINGAASLAVFRCAAHLAAAQSAALNGTLALP